MNNKLPLETLAFGSLLSYSPRGSSEVAKQSQTARNNLKTDAHLPRLNMTMTEYVGELTKKIISNYPFSKLFEKKPILVPMPKSSLMRTGDLWVPQRIAIELNKRECGGEVIECIYRKTFLPKSSTSNAKDRPTAFQHFNSMGIQTNLLSDPKEVLLVDDIITRGATTLGAANRVYLTFPKANIRVFAALRAVTPPDVFTHIFDSKIGSITSSGDHTFRKP